MTSDGTPPREAFVWIWLPGATEPVVAGRIQAEGPRYIFNYGRSYLSRHDAIPIHLPELPLQSGAIEPEPPLEIANALRDASPDAWGRRVIVNRLTGVRGRAADLAADLVDLDELTFMLQSGSDRIGALDFQASPTEYAPRTSGDASLEDLLQAVDVVDRGLFHTYRLRPAPTPPALCACSSRALRLQTRCRFRFTIFRRSENRACSRRPGWRRSRSAFAPAGANTVRLVPPLDPAQGAKTR